MPSVNTSRTHVLLLERQIYPPIAEFGGAHLQPAGSGSAQPTAVLILSLLLLSGTILDIATAQNGRFSFRQLRGSRAGLEPRTADDLHCEYDAQRN